jgi:hypothetical protein
MNAPTNLREYDATAKTVQYYTDGAKFRGPDMQPAFHQMQPSSAMRMARSFGPIQKPLNLLDQDPATGPKPGWSASTSSTMLARAAELDDQTATATTICSRPQSQRGGRS